MKRTNVIIVLMVLVFLSLSWYFSWFIMDDAYFTYRYSENLIDSFGLNWNTDGKPVEAYTTFGWAIINTIPIKFNIPPEIFSQIISIISALGIATTLLFLFERKQKIYIFPALGILLLNPAFVVITIQGMETTFTALFVLISAVSLYKSRLKLSLISSTVSMLLRPDTLIFFLFMYGFYIRKNKIKELLYNGFFLTILPLSIWFIWRVSYYGYILPNAFYVKSATSIMYYFQSMVTLSSFIAFLLPIIIFTLPFLFYVDKSIILPDIFLEKVDKATMASSIEVRVPFLDNELVDFCLSLPAKIKIKNGIQKGLLKRSLEGIVPNEILYGKKMGFGVPFEYWIKTSLFELLNDHLSGFYKKYPNILSAKRISTLIFEHSSGKKDNGFLLWKLLNFVIWANNNNLEFSNNDIN